MPSHPRELDSETEITYWRDCVSSLEVLVGELLAKIRPCVPSYKSAIPKRPIGQRL
jgi:hypothetical protein